MTGVLRARQEVNVQDKRGSLDFTQVFNTCCPVSLASCRMSCSARRHDRHSTAPSMRPRLARGKPWPRTGARPFLQVAPSRRACLGLITTLREISPQLSAAQRSIALSCDEAWSSQTTSVAGNNEGGRRQTCGGAAERCRALVSPRMSVTVCTASLEMMLRINAKSRRDAGLQVCTLSS